MYPIGGHRYDPLVRNVYIMTRNHIFAEESVTKWKLLFVSVNPHLQNRWSSIVPLSRILDHPRLLILDYHCHVPWWVEDSSEESLFSEILVIAVYDTSVVLSNQLAHLPGRK